MHGDGDGGIDIKKLLTIFGKLQITIETISPSPFEMGKAAQRRLAERILIKSALIYSTPKLNRIKALRMIAKDKNWPEKYKFGLREAKKWVEENFDDYGNGEICLR